MDKVKEIAGKALNYIKEKVGAMSKRLKIGIVAGVAAVLIALIVLGIILGQTGYAVLYTASNSAEVTQVVTALQEDLSVTDVKIDGNDILVPDNQVESLQMQLSILGYPSSSFNNSIWDTGVGMFSTDSEIREKQRQQLQSWLMGMLDTIASVDKSYVIINLSKEKSYVISTDEEKPTATVMLHLRGEEELSDEQIEGVYSLVQNAVPNLTRDCISLTDGDGRILFKSDEKNADQGENLDQIKKLYYTKLEFSNDMRNVYYDILNGLLDGVFKDFSVAVQVDMTYGKRVSESMTYTPSVDEEGTEGGMVSDKTTEIAAQGQAVEGGVVGATVDADISPDYPTVTYDENGDIMYDYRTTTNFLVNKVVEQYENDGFDVKKISATVVVEENNMTQAEIDTWQKAVANAIGANVDDVSFIPKSFVLQVDNSGSTGPVLSASNNNILIFIIVTLGVVLVILFVLAIFASGSKKKRQVRAQKAAALSGVAVGTAGALGAPLPTEEGADVYGISQKTNQKNEVELPSLLETSNEEAREAVLKREIREFSKSNPEIVAQLIRTMMKSSD